MIYLIQNFSYTLISRLCLTFYIVQSTLYLQSIHGSQVFSQVLLIPILRKQKIKQFPQFSYIGLQFSFAFYVYAFSWIILILMNNRIELVTNYLSKPKITKNRPKNNNPIPLFVEGFSNQNYSTQKSQPTLNVNSNPNL